MLVSYWSDEANGFIVDDVESLNVVHPVWASYGEDGELEDVDVLVRVPVVDEEELLRLATWINQVLEEDLVVFSTDDPNVGKHAMTVEEVSMIEQRDDR